MILRILTFKNWHLYNIFSNRLGSGKPTNLIVDNEDDDDDDENFLVEESAPPLPETDLVSINLKSGLCFLKQMSTLIILVVFLNQSCIIVHTFCYLRHP